MTKQRVFITGYSACGATGLIVDDMWQAIGEGRSGIQPNPAYEGTEFPYFLHASMAEHRPRDLVSDRKLLKLISQHDIFGLYAADEAIDHSGMMAYRDSLDVSEQGTLNARTGLFVASPGNKYSQQYDFLPLHAQFGDDMKAFARELSATVHPMWLLRALPNNVMAYTSINHQIKGYNQNVTNHGVSGLQVIIEAAAQIQAGTIDRAVVVAHDDMTQPHYAYYYGHLGLLSKTGLRAFSSDHDGTVMGEGAAAIVLESEQATQVRGAKVFAEVLSGCTRSEARGVLSINKGGEGLSSAICETLSKENVTASELGMICAHANGTPLSDSSEAKAIQSLEHDIPVTGFKWSFGHTIAAAGLLETVMTVKALEDRIVPGLPYLRNPIANFSVSVDQQTLTRPYALILARGFGSLNTSLLIKAVS